MKPPVDSVKVSSRGREILIQSKRNTGLKQWNELLRWAFCISLSNTDPPKIFRKLDSGIEPIEWTTFSGPLSSTFSAVFYARAANDGIELTDADSVAAYFRAHIERGVGALRSTKSLSSLVALTDQIERSRSGS
jgi:DNA sulfur modification protein DndE